MPPLPLVEAHSACGFTRKSKDHAYSYTETCTHTQRYTYTYICMPVDIYIYFGVAVNWRFLRLRIYKESSLSLSLSSLSSSSFSSPSSALVGTTGSTSVKIQGSLFFYEQRLPHIERDFTSCPNKIVKGLKYHRSAESTTLFSEGKSLEVTLPNCSDISLELPFCVFHWNFCVRRAHFC